MKGGIHPRENAVRRPLCVLVLILARCAGAEEKAPNTAEPAALMDWFIARDSEFFELKRAGEGLQNKFKAEVLRDLAKLPDAPAVQLYLKKQTVILNWIAQYLIYHRYTKSGKYSPEESAFLRKMEADLRAVPSKTQLLQAGYEVSDATESWLAMKVKVAACYLDRKYGEKPKEPSKDDEAELMREILPQTNKK